MCGLAGFFAKKVKKYCKYANIMLYYRNEETKLHNSRPRISQNDAKGIRGGGGGIAPHYRRVGGRDAEAKRGGNRKS
jgi:hypothetical protein